MLNDKNFTLLAGNPKKWDDEIKDEFLMADGSPKPMSLRIRPRHLIQVQKEQYENGRRSVQIMKVSNSAQPAYTTTVLLDHNLDTPFSKMYGSYETLLKATTDWANEDPENREVFIANTDKP